MSVDYNKASTEGSGIVSRSLQAEDRNYDGVVYRKGKPPCDSEHNLLQEIQNEKDRIINNAQYQSGVLDFRLLKSEPKIFGTTLDPDFSALNTLANEFIIQNFRAAVNGWILEVRGSTVNGNYPSLDWLSIEMPAPPEIGARQDLVFLEVWRAMLEPLNLTHPNQPSATEVYRYGNTQYAGTNLPEKMIDPEGNIETTRRVQIQYAIRIKENVNFDVYLNGLDDPVVKAFGPKGIETTKTFTNMGTTLDDYGLWRAGNGSDADKAALGTLDGYIYAIPICAVHRRNSTAYDVGVNPNGAGASISTGVSDRPDGLFYDQIAYRDIMDLRYGVCISGVDTQSLLESNFDRLIRGLHQTVFKSDWTGSVRGTILPQVDAISKVDQPGINDFIAPDGVRRVFSDGSFIQATPQEFTYGSFWSWPTIFPVFIYDGVDGITLNAPMIKQTTLVTQLSPISTQIDLADASGLPHKGRIKIDPGGLKEEIITFTGRVFNSLTGISVPVNTHAPGTAVKFYALIGTLTPVLVKRDTATPALVPVSASWSGLGTEVATGTISGVTSGEIVDVVFYIQYPAGQGWSHVPSKLNWLLDGAGEKMAFCEINSLYRNVLPGDFKAGPTSFPITNTYIDSAKDLCLSTFNTTDGGVRIYNGYFAGNGTSTYKTKDHFPSGVFNTAGNEIYGHTVLGFRMFALQQPPAPEGYLDPVSVTREAGGDFTIVFSAPYASTQTIRYEAILKIDGASVEYYTKGIKEIGTYEQLTTTGAGQTAFILYSNTEIVLAAHARTIDGSSYKYFAYVDGVQTDLVSITGFGNKAILITFAAAQTGSIDIWVVTTKTPQSDDKINAYYDYFPYQGLGSEIDNSVIRNIGKEGIVHTLGTGGDPATSRDRYIGAISARLPLGSGRKDYDMGGDIFGIEPFTGPPAVFFRVRTDMLQSNWTGESLGTRPVEGQKIYSVSPGTTFPALPRGVNRAWVIEPRCKFVDAKYFLAFQVPFVDALQTPSAILYESVWYFLIESYPTRELLMVVITSVEDSPPTGVGGATIVISRDDHVATDGQTIFNLSFSYEIGKNELWVFSSGLMMRLTDDYTETSTTQVTFVSGRTLGEKVTFMKVKPGVVSLGVGGAGGTEINTDFGSDYAIAYDVFRLCGRPLVKKHSLPSCTCYPYSEVYE